MTDEHEHAMKVWREACGESQEAFYRVGEQPNDPESIKQGQLADQAAAAVIAADRARLVAEVERLAQAWEAQHKEKVKERDEARLWFERAQKWAEENARMRDALGEICRDSNPDWTEKRVYPTDVLDDIHTIAVRAYYKVSL